MLTSKKFPINFSEKYKPHSKSKNNIDFMHIFFPHTNYYHTMSSCAIKLKAVKMKSTKWLKSIKYQMKVCQMEIFQIYVTVRFRIPVTPADLNALGPGYEFRLDLVTIPQTPQCTQFALPEPATSDRTFGTTLLAP